MTRVLGRFRARPKQPDSNSTPFHQSLSSYGGWCASKSSHQLSNRQAAHAKYVRLGLIRHRKKRLLDAKSFNNEAEIDQHINLITEEDLKINDKTRTLELKNWLNYLKEGN